MTIEELAADCKIHKHEELRAQGWACAKDLIDLGVKERTARDRLLANSTEKRMFRIEGVRNWVNYYKLKV
jgi:hypothetical protein